MMGFLCALPGAAVLIAACALPAPFATGYVEGDFALVAPVEVARIDRLAVDRGARVAAGDLLARLETRDAEIALAQADAALAEAEGRLADLKEGKRPEEIRVIEATLASTRAAAEEADRAMTRLMNLADRGAATRTESDDAVTAAQVAHARVAEAEAQLAVARLPARPDAIAAAAATVAGARAARDSASWKLDQRMLHAPAAGIVHDVIRHAGEIAGPDAPVVSLLPDGAVKLRLFVPETAISAVARGSRLAVRCDGCPEGLAATVSYVSDGPEFTPPVIYSLENRQKLVYLIEARPDPGSSLKPGQIVDVALPEPAR
jgi:HlyD family secretion protein